MRTWILVDASDPGGPTTQVTQATRPRRAGQLIVDSWPADDPPPTSSDARVWDDWRLRRGYSGTH